MHVGWQQGLAADTSTPTSHCTGYRLLLGYILAIHNQKRPPLTVQVTHHNKATVWPSIQVTRRNKATAWPSIQVTSRLQSGHPKRPPLTVHSVQVSRYTSQHSYIIILASQNQEHRPVKCYILPIVFAQTDAFSHGWTIGTCGRLRAVGPSKQNLQEQGGVQHSISVHCRSFLPWMDNR